MFLLPFCFVPIIGQTQKCECLFALYYYVGCSVNCLVLHACFCLVSASWFRNYFLFVTYLYTYIYTHHNLFNQLSHVYIFIQKAVRCPLSLMISKSPIAYSKTLRFLTRTTLLLNSSPFQFQFVSFPYSSVKENYLTLSEKIILV